MRWWIKFGLLMAAQILAIGFMADFVQESPAILTAIVIWYFFIGFTITISGISWMKEIQNAGERSPKFTISFTRITLISSLIIPAGLFLIAVVFPDLFAVPLILLTLILGPAAGVVIWDRINSFPYCNRAHSNHKIAVGFILSFTLLALLIGWAWGRERFPIVSP